VKHHRAIDQSQKAQLKREKKPGYWRLLWDTLAVEKRRWEKRNAKAAAEILRGMWRAAAEPEALPASKVARHLDVQKVPRQRVESARTRGQKQLRKPRKKT
jgi:hypothetical protein